MMIWHIITGLLTKYHRAGLIAILLVTSCFSPLNLWRVSSVETQIDTPIEIKAEMVGLSEEEFRLFSAVVEAESDRTDNLEGKVLVALTIWNRVNSDQWPNSVTRVISQDGQFQVYYQGTYRSVGQTDLSDVAVVEAFSRIQEGDAPNVIYFNCLGYDYLGTPYCYEGGNYFELGT